jgi:hypothetical protein
LALERLKVTGFARDLAMLSDDGHEVQESQVSQENELKRGKFSAKETKMILEEIERYMDDNELALEDICPELREEKKRTIHSSLWNRLAELLPMRSKTVSFRGVQFLL